MKALLALIPAPPDFAKVSSFVYRWSAFLLSIGGVLAGVWAGVNPGLFHIGASLAAEITSGLLGAIGVLTVLHDRTKPLPVPPAGAPGAPPAP